ncbi:MAG: polyphosphate kinase 2 [Crocinitomicaceae bacterium]|nr:polyphosphate kinase 2 [Crocinitomicaceae bacterium]|tara:strand:- start:8932 stop:9804 length:873 start_codon:yes stop_codon:yes gene_type:complete
MTKDIEEVIEGLSEKEIDILKSYKGLRRLLSDNEHNVKKALNFLKYERELELLQTELVQLQNSIQKEGRRVIIIFEGRDSAGKGGSIKRFTEHLSPRAMNVVALSKPSQQEVGQWYFQRYTNHLPNAGEIVFFDRSWYNRAVVEPVMGFCTNDQYKRFIRQVPEFEHMLYESGIEIIKFWFSISKKEQGKRFESRKTDPHKQWKISSVDQKAQEMWDEYTKYKNHMFSRTHSEYCPWIIVRADKKKVARLESIRYVLSLQEYENKGLSGVSLDYDPNVVMRYYRELDWED